MQPPQLNVADELAENAFLNATRDKLMTFLRERPKSKILTLKP